MLQDVLIIISQILFWPCFVYALYLALLSLVSLISHKQKYEMQEDKQRFCIFVPSHNEEDIIAATVKNYSHINYNPALFDVYFLADNCNDETASRARKAIAEVGMPNFHTLERNVSDPDKQGKAHALRWGMDLLEENGGFYSKYDMFVILDADNFVDSDFLKHINSQYLSYKEKKRPAIIQAYLDSKNKENIISRGYFVAYRHTNGFLQLAKHKLHLTPCVVGTGFAISVPFLQRIGGYCCHSLVEDLEFESITTLHGERIAYNQNVRIYDERPTTFKDATVQKIRWCQGHWWVFAHFAPRILLHMLNPLEIRLFFRRLDNLIHLFASFLMLLSTLSLLWPVVMLCALQAFVVTVNPIVSLISACSFAVIILFIPISSLMDGKREEKRRVLIDFIPNILAYSIHMVSYYIANVIGLFRSGNQKVWLKTPHKVTSITYSADLEPEVAGIEEETASAPKALSASSEGAEASKGEKSAND